MADRQTEFADLVAALYRGALSDSAWAEALDRVGERLRGSAIFFATDGPEPEDRGMVGYRIDPAAAALMGGPLATPEANPFLLPMQRTPVGRAVPTSRMCGDAALVRSAIFELALKPFGQRFVLGATLERLGPRSTVMAVSRSAAEGDYDERDIAFLDQLLPHLARALHFRSEFAAARQLSSAQAAALDAVPRGILILARDGSIAFANQEAQRILRLQDGFGIARRGPWTSDPDASPRLRAALKAAVQPNGEQPPGPIVVRRSRGRAPLTVSVIRTPADALGAIGTGAAPAATLFLYDPDANTEASLSLLRDLYGLTWSEAKLAIALLDNELAHAAQRLGISVNTAKTQLQAIFHKVGVSRQSALVRRLTLDLGC